MISQKNRKGLKWLWEKSKKERITGPNDGQILRLESSYPSKKSGRKPAENLIYQP